ncbi:hypothetical protein ACOBV8_21775 (plasmid) [Pseudoalteromonas espejiana]
MEPTIPSPQHNNTKNPAATQKLAQALKTVDHKELKKHWLLAKSSTWLFLLCLVCI